MRDEQKLLVQVFLSQGVIGEADLNQVYQEICQRCGIEERAPLAEFRTAINNQLGKVSMEIRRKRDEDSGEQMYALVQTVESELGKLTTDYQPNQLELFKKIVGLAVASAEGNGTASSIDVLNLTNELETKMSKEDAEASLRQFVKDQWLKESEGDVWLSSRSIMELEMYLRQTYQIDDCHNCKEMVIKGQPCSQCEIKLHGYCADRLFRGRGGRFCPNCNNPWQ